MPARLLHELAPHVLGAVIRRFRDFAAAEEHIYGSGFSIQGAAANADR